MSTVVIDDVTPREQFTAASGQTVFNTNFTANIETDVSVYQRASGAEANDVTDKLTYNTDYTVTFVGGSETVRVTLVSGATVGDIVTVVRDTSPERDNLYINTNFTPTMLNGDFGRSTLIEQQNEMYARLIGLRYNVSESLRPVVDTVIPQLDADQTWVMNATTTAIVAASFPSGGAASKVSTFVTITDETADEPNSFPLATAGNGFMVNDVSGSQILTRSLAVTSGELSLTNDTGLAGNPTFGIANNPTIPGTAGFQIPTGTTAQRVTPVSPAINLRYNTDLGLMEYYDHANTDWSQIPGSASGAYLELSGGTMAGNIDMGTNSITNLPVPSASTEAATKGYVDGIAFNVHAACNYGTTGNLAGYTYSNGTAGVGATLTAGSNGAFSIDGSSPVANDRILVKDQTNQAENGLFTLTQVGDASNPAILTRATDYDEASDMDAGDEVAIIAGSTLVGSKWMMTQTAAITVGTTAITWVDISVPANLVTIDGTQTITGAKTFNDLTLGNDLDADSNKIVNVTDPTAAQDAATKSYVDSSAAPGVTKDITQGAHGFVVGDVLRISGSGTYAKAQADSVANAEVVGIVDSVATASEFTLLVGGYISTLSALTANEVYFLDPTTAGALTTTEPTTDGQISKPILWTDSTSSGYVFNMRGLEVGPAITTNYFRKNLIIGGDFSLNPWQRGTSVTGISNGEFVADRFKTSFVTSAVANVLKTVDAPTVSNANILTQHCHESVITTADATIAAGDYFLTRYFIEGYDFAAIAQQSFTLSFWIKSNATGTMCVSFVNTGDDRSYVSEVTIDSAATWEKKTITVTSSPSGGTWSYTTGAGLKVGFALAGGSTFQTTADAWQTGEFYTTSSQTNFLATTSNYVRIALVQIEKGTDATEFEARHFEQEVSLCQRYYCKTYNLDVAPGTLTSQGALEYISSDAGATLNGQLVSFPVNMRGVPSMTFHSTGIASTANWYNAGLATASGAASAAVVGLTSAFIRNPQVGGDGKTNAIRIQVEASAEI